VKTPLHVGINPSLFKLPSNNMFLDNDIGWFELRMLFLKYIQNPRC
jgi:hypothetical protein